MNFFRGLLWGVLLVTLIGTIFYIVGLFTSPDGFPASLASAGLVWPILFVTFGIIGLTLGRALSGLTPSKALSGGPLGIGRIISVSRTGLSINDQPQLLIEFAVTTLDGNTFTSRAKQIVDLTQLAQLQPGVTLPVRYNPQDPSTVAIATNADPKHAQAVLNRIELASGNITARQLRIAEEGIAAQAVVLTMTPTGEIRSGNRSVIDVTLRVTRADASTFDRSVQKAFPPPAIPHVQVGSVVRVTYLPGDESDLVIETPLN